MTCNYHEYPNCSDCPAYADTCDGNEEQWKEEEVTAMNQSINLFICNYCLEPLDIIAYYQLSLTGQDEKFNIDICPTCKASIMKHIEGLRNERSTGCKG